MRGDNYVLEQIKAIVDEHLEPKINPDLEFSIGSGIGQIDVRIDPDYQGIRMSHEGNWSIMRFSIPVRKPQLIALALDAFIIAI